ncbi:MAG: heparinase II/III-family protein [Pirellulales bacterium]|nr:heparinase II/III-family protein [Pirellulales bacterium]
MSIGSTTGVLPPNMPTTSLILGDDLANLQAQWVTPVNSQQLSWRNSANSRASQNTSGAVPVDFGVATNDASIAQAAGLRFAMTGNVADLNKAVGALSLADVPGGTFITRPEVLTSYLAAYDFIRGASNVQLPQATRDTIEARLLSLSQSLDYGNQTYSNARAKIGATRALAGVLLRDQDQLDTGLADLQGHFDYSTTDDGWFTDSQGHYLNYTLRHWGYFLRAYEQGSGVDLYENLRPYVDMSLGLRLPDGTVPNVSNGLNEPIALHFFSQDSDPTTAANILWNTSEVGPSPYSFDQTAIENNDWTNTTDFALTDFSAVAPQAPTRSPTYFAPGQSAVSVFREDWGATSDYLLLSPGVDSPAFHLYSDDPPIDAYVPAFHSHNDTGEILVASQGKYILVAPGYDRDDLTNSPPNFGPRDPTWHNVVLVDGTLGGTDFGRRMRPEDFVRTNRLDSTEFGTFHGVSDFSTLQMNYGGVAVTRSVAAPHEDYYVVADRMDGNAAHTYAFNLVGRGVRTVLTNTPDYKQVRWEYQGAQVIENLIASQSMTFSAGNLWMHDTFDNFQQTYRMRGTMTGATDGLFLSVIETGPIGPAHLYITKLSNDSQWLAMRVAHDTAGWTDYILSQHSLQSRTAGALSSDARYAYIRQQGLELTGLMMAEGTQLGYLGDTVLELSNPATLSLRMLIDQILGTVSDDGLVPGTELRIFDRGTIAWATLDGVFLPVHNGLDFGGVFLPHGGELVIQFGVVPEPSSCVLAAIGVAGAGLFVRRKQARRRG